MWDATEFEDEEEEKTQQTFTAEAEVDPAGTKQLMSLDRQLWQVFCSIQI